VPPALQRPTNEVAGKIQLRPSPQSLPRLQVAPVAPSVQRRVPSLDAATQAPSAQSPASRQGAPERPVVQSPLAPARACKQRPLSQSESDAQGA
jgi:hypothetical protein